MDRRAFIGTGIASLVAIPVTTLSQQINTVRRIGLLSLGDPGVTDAERQQFWAPARKLGWIEGDNLIVESRFAGLKAERLRPLADELVRLNVDVIVTSGTDAALAAKNATTTIPIIMYSAGDPVRAGLVASLARPGGNITGFSALSPELEGKQLELLRELLPAAQRVGVLVNSKNPMSFVGRKEYEETFSTLHLQPIFIEVAMASELENAVAEVARRRGEALVVPADWLFVTNAGSIMGAALHHRLPAVVPQREMLEAGGLALYSVSESSAEIADKNRRYFILLDKILRGAKPGIIPIEQPTKFELILNLKIAKMLGLTIPQRLLLRADEVIR
jgi:putative tryptophan/tyrosine transport system substrate-binding protein